MHLPTLPRKFRPTAALVVPILMLLGTESAAGQAATADSATRKSAAAFTLTGRVVNTAQQPIAGASLWLKGTAVAATTNADGVFLLETTKPAPYVLVIDAARHVVTEVTVADARQPVEVRLYPIVRR